MARGRPKQFDDDEVLARAMAVFWRQGYEATSLDDLITAMGIPRQSLYRTFTDKRTLFLKALEYYDKHVTNVVIGMLNAEGPAVENLRRVFELWGRTVNAPERIGCLMVNAGVQGIPGDSEVERLVRANQKRGVAALEKALERAQLEGDIAASVTPKAMARTLCAAINGLLGMSRSGVSDAFKKDVLASLPALIGMQH